MPLTVPEKISQNNPHLELLFLLTKNGFDYYCRCGLIPQPAGEETTDFCHQTEGLKIRREIVDFELNAMEFLPHSPIPCAECPVCRQYLEQNLST